ncbi:MAG: DNA mismatch repair endonuclease MutL [Candidatus Woesearchaeota archaeon]|jgi:DNA mismatch repair protein MutL|nr:DNA mismatch repair endonuclease MutL [Candidatus Woesearchaeota archaeon]
MSINILPGEIINQIAAGEVIENPSAVIKELVENSIDANASQIDVEIEDSGLKKIVIKDNGKGISKEDLLKAPLRHATSKIKNFDDLYHISTMGFRGEALASIFSVSNAKIVSKTHGSNEAYEITSENTNEVKVSATSLGTTISVENLFYNTPARKKYMKSSNLELKAIVDIMNRFLVYYNEVKFTLKHNGKLLINKPQFKSKLDNLYYILGKDLKDNLIYFENENYGIKVSGFLGKPSQITYGYKKNQHLYVNSRYVKSKLINDSMYEGFSTNLMEGRHPLFVLFVEIDPEIIDVNVHPTKIEIRFENELEIYEFVKNSIREVFEKVDTIKPFDKAERNYSLDEVSEVQPVREYTKQEVINKHYTKDVQKTFEVNEDEIDYKKSYDFQEDILEDSQVEQEKKEISYGPLFEILEDYRILGQVDKTFIIVETKNEMILFDQHVVEEKFFYETFKKQIEEKSVKKQVLLKPDIINFSQSEMLLYKDNVGMFEKLGFEIEEFGSNEIVVRSVPIGLSRFEVSAKIVADIIGEITVDKKFKLLEDSKLDKIASMSCKKSLKGGEELTIPQIHMMIENLKRLKEPFNCPHGRPIMLRYTFKDLEKNFKRIV